MESSVDMTLESRKEWTAPELKKIDVDEITAAGGVNTEDGAISAS